MTTSKVRADNAADVDIANRIMNALIVKGISIKGLSEATGIAQHTIRRSLHQNRADRRSFKIQELESISAALNTPPSAFMPEAFAA